MYRNIVVLCFVFVLFAKSPDLESEKCNLMEVCIDSASGDRNFMICSVR